MRPTPWIDAEQHRASEVPGFESDYGDPYGVFLIPHRPTGVNLRVIASDGDYKAAGASELFAWEHVSVSLPNRCPNWPEMSFIKDLFWRDDEVVMQLHPAKADHINYHPYCLHLWRPLNAAIPLPPKDAVGPSP